MFTFNPFTKKLDYSATGLDASLQNPLSGTGTPNGSVISRFVGDEYVDNDTQIKYTNPTIGDTGWEVIQTLPAN